MPQKIITRKINGETYVLSRQKARTKPKSISAKEFYKISGELLKEGEEVNTLGDALNNPDVVVGLSNEMHSKISAIHEQRLSELNKKLFELQQLAANENLPINEILEKLKKRKIIPKRKLIRKR